MPSMKVEVRIEFDGTIGLFKNGFRLNCKPIEKRKERGLQNQGSIIITSHILGPAKTILGKKGDRGMKTKKSGHFN